AREPLPRMLVVLLAGALAWALLGRTWSVRLDELLSNLAPWLFTAGTWVRPIGAIVFGVTAGGLLARPVNAALKWFFQGFNWGFSRTTSAYTRTVSLALRGSGVVLMVYGGLIVLTWWVSRQLPTGYIPTTD